MNCFLNPKLEGRKAALRATQGLTSARPVHHQSSFARFPEALSSRLVGVPSQRAGLRQEIAAPTILNHQATSNERTRRAKVSDVVATLPGFDSHRRGGVDRSVETNLPQNVQLLVTQYLPHTNSTSKSKAVAAQTCDMLGYKSERGLLDHHTAQRIAFLRKIQGLSFDVPVGHTVYRQSDFESSKLWRYVMIGAFVVCVSTLFEPEPQSAAPAAQSVTAKTYASGTLRTVASDDASFHSQYTTQSSSMSSCNQDGNGKYDGLSHARFNVCRSRANVSISSLT